MKRLDLVVGPNGAGKSTFVDLVLAPQLPQSVFVNADEIARHRWPGEAESRSYDAARIAADTRAQLVALGHSFIAETVFSHESKLALIRDAQLAGYVVALHVLLVPEQLAVERVERRVRAGGHSVPESKIRGRYHRLWPLVSAAIAASDQSTVYDSADKDSLTIVADFVAGILVGEARWPAWTPSALVKTTLDSGSL